MGMPCHRCQKNMGRLEWKHKRSEFPESQDPQILSMGEDDRICEKCEREVSKALKGIRKENKEKEKEEKSEIKGEIKQQFQELMDRSPEYKKHWNKNGVIQFKNERIAILQRSFGTQVEFIVAFDDVTKEGYRLMAIDEGKTGNAGGVSGGANSYYYFQKMDFVK